jgi:glycosyltransferase involved in cell wall biosynthesis
MQETGKISDAILDPKNSETISLLSVGTETALFDRRSRVRERILAYARRFKKTEMLVMCGRGYKEEHIGSTVLRPTNSYIPLFRLIDALEIGYRIKNVDIVTAQDPFETGLVAWIIASLKGIPLHIQVHTDLFSPAYAALSLKNRIRVRIARIVLKKAARIRVVSERIKKSIEEHIQPTATITVLPIFTDTERFRHAPIDRDLIQRFAAFTKKILVVSRLEPEKNVALAIRSFAMAAPKDACLIIVGGGALRASLGRTVDELKIANRVFFENSSDVALYYKIADLVLVPSHYEGYGLVILEALAAGKPVLSTDVGISREAGALIVTRDTFAESLREWFKSGPRTGHLGPYPYKNFDEYVRMYCEDIVACASGK